MAKLTFSNSQYGNGTTPENALNNALLQYPEIASTLIQQFPRYTLTLLLEKVGLYASEKVLGDNSFEWKVMGRYNKKQFIASTADTSHTAGQKVAFTFSDTSGGSAVSENWAYPETHKNFLTIMRKKCTVTGKDATDVTWIENNGSRLWYFTREQQLMDQFMYEQELQRWYGKRSIASPVSNYTSTNADIFSEDVSDQSLADGTEGRVIIGDGLLAQIDSSNQATYTAGALTEDIITEFLAKLSLNATNSEGNEYLVYTGTEGRLAFHKAMKDLLIAPSGSYTGGSFAGVNGDVELGANFTSYMALGNKITVAYCPVFDDNHMHGSTSGTNAFGDSRLKESAKMVFLDMGSTSGVNNIELITKGADGMNRSFVKKYVTGMVNPYDANSMMAANADDKFECHVLAESGIVVRNPLSCGILSVA